MGILDSLKKFLGLGAAADNSQAANQEMPEETNEDVVAEPQAPAEESGEAPAEPAENVPGSNSDETDTGEGEDL